MYISHRLAVSVTRNRFSSLIIIRSKLRKIVSAKQNDPKMTFSVTRSKVRHKYSTSTHESQISPRFPLRSLVFQIIETFRFSGDFEIVGKIVNNRKLTI